MRKTSLLICSIALGGCSTTSETVVSNEPVERCSVSECFNRHQIREFELIDNTTMVLYVGAQRCPFKVEFEGTFCDLTFLPGGNVEFTSIRQPRPANMRICAHDRDMGLAERGWTTAGGGAGAVPSNQLPCEIRDVASLTDDQLIELLVDNDLAAPPPPFGSGEIQVGENEADGSADAAAEGAEASEDTDAVDLATRPTAANETR